LISDGIISKIDQIKPLLEQALEQKRPLLVVAADVQGEALNTLILNSVKQTVECAAVRGFGYGNARKVNIADLSLILNGEAKGVETIGGGENDCIKVSVGSCEEVVIGKNSTLFTTKEDKLQKIKLSKEIA